MELGRVVGTVVADRKCPGLEGIRLLIVQPVRPDGGDRGHELIAADAVRSAGPGTLVWLTTSREAALALPEPFVPVDAAIVGIVDQVHEDPASGLGDSA